MWYVNVLFRDIMEFILITVQYSIKTLIYTMVKNYWVIVQNIMLYLMIGKMHKNTMKHYSNNFKCPSRRQQKLQTNQWYFYVKYTTDL